MRYATKNPFSYVHANIAGQVTLLETIKVGGSHLAKTQCSYGACVEAFPVLGYVATMVCWVPHETDTAWFCGHCPARSSFQVYFAAMTHRLPETACAGQGDAAGWRSSDRDLLHNLERRCT